MHNERPIMPMTEAWIDMEFKMATNKIQITLAIMEESGLGWDAVRQPHGVAYDLYSTMCCATVIQAERNGGIIDPLPVIFRFKSFYRQIHKLQPLPEKHPCSLAEEHITKTYGLAEGFEAEFGTEGEEDETDHGHVPEWGYWN